MERIKDFEELYADPSITEIIVNGPNQVWLERQGQLQSAPTPWASEVEYRQFIRSVLDSLNADLSLQEPFCSGRIENFRVQVIGPPVSALPIIAFRRLLPRSLTLCDWQATGGISAEATRVLKLLIKDKKNIMVYGATGSGKTTLLSSMLAEVAHHERVLLLEDIEELSIPNPSSARLLTRADTSGVLKEISLSDLVRHSLRLRPDRLALGEVRGPEAKDLLMALATGHRGSFGTLHAQSFNEALLRLEMLVQLGAPQWQAQSIRQLILLSIHGIVGIQKNAEGQRTVTEIHRLTGLENFGFLSERLA